MNTRSAASKWIILGSVMAGLLDLAATITAGQQATDMKPDPSLAQVHGTVVDEYGKPVAGAEVKAVPSKLDGAPPHITTAVNGTFRLVLDAPSSRYHTFVATSEGGARQAIFSLADTPVERVVQIHMVLKPARLLTVHVTDAEKKPVPGAAVGVMEQSTMLATGETDRAGKIAFRLPADAGLSQVVALKPDLGFDYFENYRSWPGSSTLPPPAEVTLQLDGAQALRVNAIDPAGKPLANVNFVPWTVQKKGRIAYVNLSAAGDLKFVLAQTDAKGKATSSWIPRDLIDGVTFLAVTREFHLPMPPHYDAAKPDAPLTAVLRRTVGLRGKAVLPDGKPAPGILIQAEGRGDTAHYYRGLARTRADGSFHFDVYPDQCYVIAVTDAEWAARSYTSIFLKEGMAPQEFSFRLDKGTVIRGKLTVGKEKKPVASETITLIEKAMPNPADPGGAPASLVRWAATDKDGKYSIRVGSGIYDLSASAGARAAAPCRRGR